MTTGARESGGTAAFFDLDGTLLELPSLERRFFRILHYRREIPAKNYLLWLKETVRLMPQGIVTVLQANKMYLCGIQSFHECDEGDGGTSSRHKGGHQAEGQASAPLRRNPRLPVPAFFPQAIDRAAWHAKQGHPIILISGTLEPLAQSAARAMEAELAARGILAMIRVCATRLEEKNGRWTGKVLSEAMFGEAKARAAKSIASEMKLDLARCFAYGDSASDQWLLAAVGKPSAVNPSRQLAQIARRCEWTVFRWNEGKRLTRRPQKTQSSQRSGSSVPGLGDETQGRSVKQTGNLTNHPAMREANSRSLG